MEIKPLLRFVYRARIRSLTRQLALLESGDKDAFRAVEEAKARGREVIKSSARRRLILFTRRRNFQKALKAIESPGKQV